MEENNPFKFLKNKNKILYEQFTESWKYYKTDFIYAHGKLRTGIKKFAEAIQKEDKKFNKTTNNIKENTFKTREKLDINILAIKGIVPKDGDYIKILETRNNIEYDGASLSEEDIQRYKKVLNIMYKGLYKHYEKQEPKNNLNYNYFPIQEYKIKTYKETEFLGEKHIEYIATRNNTYGVEETCLIREYKAKEKLLYAHAETVLISLRKNINEKVKNLMEMVEIKTKEKNPYRYIGYILDNNMQNLKDITLKTWNNKQKIKLIKDIINGIYELSIISNYKINHRNIRPENIYITQKEERYIAKIGNFEISKITMENQRYESANNYIKKQYEDRKNFNCYYPKTGWETANTFEEWEKVDVYSLGKMIEYICFDKVIQEKYTLENFKDKGYPTKLGEIYFKMTNNIANNRPTIKELKEEIKKVREGSIKWRKKTL